MNYDKLKFAENFVILVQNCEPKVHTFYLQSELDKFVLEFLLDNQDNEDNRIDLIYKKGMITYSGYLYYDNAEASAVSEETEYVKTIKDYNAASAVAE